VRAKGNHAIEREEAEWEGKGEKRKSQQELKTRGYDHEDCPIGHRRGDR